MPCLRLSKRNGEICERLRSAESSMYGCGRGMGKSGGKGEGGGVGMWGYMW